MIFFIQIRIWKTLGPIIYFFLFFEYSIEQIKEFYNYWKYFKLVLAQQK
jgi:hypothetical protein